MRFRNILATGALATVAVVSLGSAANAYTIDAAGKGFVGKGEVQSAFGFSNGPMQKAVDAKQFTFSAKQATTQSLTQSVEQDGTQVGTQVGTEFATQAGSQALTMTMSQDLTCDFTNGNGSKTFHRDGIRDGERTGARTGERVGTREGVRDVERDGKRTGSQAGVQSGNIASDVAFTDKKTGQYTGFNLTKFTSSNYKEVGAPVWGAPTYDAWDFTNSVWSFGDYAFTGDYGFGAYEFGTATFEPLTGVEWGDWEADSGENPADCLRSQNADHITMIDNLITEGVVTDGAISNGAISVTGVEDGAITEGAVTPIEPPAYGAIVPGAVVNDGLAKVFVTYTPVLPGVPVTKAL
jgi:hypothetical protein